MNKQRRKTLDSILEILRGMEDGLNEAVADIESVKDEETEAFEGVSENFPNSEQAENMSAAVDALGEAQDAVQQMLDSFDEAVDAIETAIQ